MELESPLRLDEGGEWLADIELPDNIDQVIAGCPKPTAIDLTGGIFCNLCHYTFSNKKEFDRHYTDQHYIIPSAIVYTCVACRKEIAPYPNFRNHCYLKHVVKERFKCEQCPKQFSKQSILNNHINAMHNFKCASCHEEFSSKSELHTHKNMHKRDKDKPPYPCHNCSKQIETVDMCEMHIDEHCKILYPCPICNETTDSKMETTKHLTKHFDEVITNEFEETEISADSSVDMLGGVLCSYCDELFKNRVDFEQHFINEHSDSDIIYSCNICGKQHQKYHSFADHCYSHVAKNRFECMECGRLFPRLSLLVLHTEAFHSGDYTLKPFRCAQCSHAFGTAQRLKEHMRIVHTLDTYCCPEEGCDITFATSRELVLHQRQHRMDGGLYCHSCGLQFRELSACRAHLDVHRRKHFACPVCDKQYREKYLILKHIPTHFESVLHVCKVCGKVFNARHRLVEHTKTHSEVRRHVCSHCGKAFMKPYQLEQHLNIHTGSKPHKCTMCPKTFASLPNCTKHLRKIHNIVKTKLQNLVDESREIPKNFDLVKNTKIAKKTDFDAKSESGIESISPEMSLDTYIFGESDDSTMDSLDPANIVKDWCILNENSLVDNSPHYTDMQTVTNATYETEQNTNPVEYSMLSENTILLEYGPEFNMDDGIHLDDHYLPHIDPLLTIKLPTPALPTAATIPEPNWEPLITKVYHSDDVNRISIVNTDIY